MSFEMVKKHGGRVCAKMITMTICLALLTLVGCGKGATRNAGDGQLARQEAPCSVVVYAPCKGQALKVPTGAIDYPMGSIESEKYTGYVIADGTPELKGQVYSHAKKSDSGRSKETKLFSQDYEQSCMNARPDSPEIDLLGAINLAARDARAHDADDIVICVVGTGLSTSGPLITTPEVLNSDAHFIIEQLKSNGSIGDFQGIEIRFYGIGCGNEEQPIPDSVRKKLENLWGAIVEAGDGTVVFCGDAVEYLDDESDLPPVTIFSFPPDRIEVKPGETREITMDSTVLEFEGDSDTFANPDEAESRLESYAADIVDGNLTIAIKGYTADSPARDEEFLMDLSQKRADRVASTLIGFGVSPGNIESVIGCGSAESTSMESGTFDENQARRDRKVVITVSA